jgi:fructuronate reductase
VVERLAPQDGLYAVLERVPREDRVRVVATVREALAARDAPERVLARIAGPATSVVTLTVTWVEHLRANGVQRAVYAALRES